MRAKHIILRGTPATKLTSKDTIHDRGGTFRLKRFLNDRGPSTKSRRNDNLVSETAFFVYLSHEIRSSGCYLGFAKVGFRGEVENS